MRVIIALLAVLLVNACRPTDVAYQYLTGQAQGTMYNIKYKALHGELYADEVRQKLDSFDLVFSTYINTSDISRINNNDTTVVLNEQFKYLLGVSREISATTGGAFDITIGPVAKVWGFGAEKKTDSINTQMIDSLLTFVGMDKVEVQGNRLIKKYPQTTLNANAIAQGYVVDVLAEWFEGLGITDYMVEVGGELRTKGVNEKGKPWKVGIDKPSEENTGMGERELQEILAISGKSLATSGNYRKFYEENGVKYSHTIDPSTGYPIRSNLLSATIITSRCIVADGYATACMVLGVERSYALVESRPDLEAYFIYADEQGNIKVKYTPGVAKMIEQ